MNKQIFIRELGTWIDVPSVSIRAFVPFGRTKLNALGLFYFRQHFYKAVKAEFIANSNAPIQLASWVTLLCGRRVFVAPSNDPRPEITLETKQ